MRRKSDSSEWGPGVERGARTARAFTMVEMMVVIVVIAILATITIGLANRVSEGGKQALTENTIKALEQVLTDYKAARGIRPPSWVTTDRTMVEEHPANPNSASADEYSQTFYTFPLIDGRYDGRSEDIDGNGLGANRYDAELDPAQPTGVLFLLLAAEEAGGVDAILKSFDSRVVKRMDVWGYGWETDDGDPVGGPEHLRLRVPVVVDGFGAPIRFVHPSFDGGHGDYWGGTSVQTRPRMQVQPNGGGAQATFTRSYRPFDPGTASSGAVGDGDEGICLEKNPYFYSAGNDGDPGTRKDNIYTIEPRFPKDTVELQ